MQSFQIAVDWKLTSDSDRELDDAWIARVRFLDGGGYFRSILFVESLYRVDVNEDDFCFRQCRSSEVGVPREYFSTCSSSRCRRISVNAIADREPSRVSRAGGRRGRALCARAFVCVSLRASKLPG